MKTTVDADVLKQSLNPDSTAVQALASGHYRGLRNRGATCYLNATLQVLFMTEAFRERVLLGTSSDTSEILVSALKKLFKELSSQDGAPQSVSTKGVIKALGIQNVREQQDAVEHFLEILEKAGPNLAEEHEYSLYAVINHSGTRYGGHYTADIRSFTENKWYCFNDSYVRETNERKLKSSTEAYLLLYQKIWSEEDVKEDKNAEPGKPVDTGSTENGNFRQSPDNWVLPTTSTATDIVLKNAPDHTSVTTAWHFFEQFDPSDFCGERFSHGAYDITRTNLLHDTDGTELQPKRFKRHREIKSISDVIKILGENVDETSDFSICISRDQMLETGLKQWQRQKKSSPKNTLRVTIEGEDAADKMVTEIEKHFFDGGENGKTPKYSMTDMEKYNFKTVGEIFAVSIAQGGPPPNFFTEWCYNYISTGETNLEVITERDVTDPVLTELIKEIKAADNTTLMECRDRILLCGYKGEVSIQRKEDIVRSVVLHDKVRPADYIIAWFKYYLKQRQTEFTCPAFDEGRRRSCGAKLSYQGVCRLIHLTNKQRQFLEENISLLTARNLCEFKACPGCLSYVERRDKTNLCVRCTICTANKKHTYNFCWSCRREWKGPTHNAVRCSNDGCGQTTVSGDHLVPCTAEFKERTLRNKGDDIYPMKDKSSDRRRLALLINNVEFEYVDDRVGAEKDELSMETLLKGLGYTVLTLRDLTAQGMSAAMRDFSQREEHVQSDSCFVVFMSHGSTTGICGVSSIVNSNGEEDIFSTDEIYNCLNTENCPGLQDKPKIILIQSCRGDTVSYRDPEKGSDFFQDMVEIFNKHAHEDHIEELFRKAMSL
ncbi:caspase-1-like isoform X1 [Labeo rohita]|uniref:Ubiquitin carboxyl-terminal hydrolase n=1 Tax=Labeo rohita TaxID=84645 RepID=A0A498LCW1_LABRO|nr:caspase-1-like isoform X1 [Labeo rohita]